MDHRRLALSCDRSGCVREVLRDDLGIFDRDPTGLPMARFVAPSSMTRFFSLLSELRREHAVFGWELLLSVNQEEILLHVAGAQNGDGMLLIGSDDWQDVTRLNDELIRINNEQLNQLRGMIKERARHRPGPEPDLMDRMSSVGNDLSTTQRRLAKQERELERLVEGQNVLIGMLVHDLRSPLTAIGGSASLLLEDDNLTHDQKELLASIETACDNMSRLVAETLDWTKLESSTVELQLASTDLNELVEEVLRVQRIIAGRQGVVIDFTHDAELPRIEVDPLRMRQVLDNLLSNAIRFAPPGSEVEVAFEREDDELVITIRDRGAGIDPELVPTLFEPFAGDAAGGNRPGYGLGLAIVKRIVELHGGTVSIQPDHEVGTRAEVRLALR